MVAASQSTSRRSWLAVGVGVVAGAPSIANAGVTIDIAKYGDKELKVATINKIKQLLRNELLQNPKQAPDWLKLAIVDALAFNSITGEGGPDASVQFDVANMKLTSAKPIIDKLKDIQTQVQRTTEVSLADLIAYAGAEAIEASGGPRIQVQVGRYDATKPVGGAQPHLDFYDGLDGAALTKAFDTSGLSPKDMALMVGAIVGVEKAAQLAAGGGATAKKGSGGGGDEDDDDMFPEDGGIFIPQTFGSQKAMFGDLLTKEPFDQTVFSTALNGKAGKCGMLLGSGEVADEAKKYASGKRELYIKDLTDSYMRVSSNGCNLTGAKVLQ